MPFEPKSEEELALANCWEPGIYDFEVIEAEQKWSAKGNEMLALKLKIWHPDGRTMTVRDWLVASDANLPLMKLRHYCRTTGTMEAYESGSLDNFPRAGAIGKLRLKIEHSDDYGPQNRVADYHGDNENPVAVEPLHGVASLPLNPGMGAKVVVEDSRGVPEDDSIPF